MWQRHWRAILAQLSEISVTCATKESRIQGFTKNNKGSIFKDFFE
jgi:hypothetical protein